MATNKIVTLTACEKCKKSFRFSREGGYCQWCERNLCGDCFPEHKSHLCLECRKIPKATIQEDFLKLRNGTVESAGDLEYIEENVNIIIEEIGNTCNAPDDTEERMVKIIECVHSIRKHLGIGESSE